MLELDTTGRKFSAWECAKDAAAKASPAFSNQIRDHDTFYEVVKVLDAVRPWIERGEEAAKRVKELEKQVADTNICKNLCSKGKMRSRAIDAEKRVVELEQECTTRRDSALRDVASMQQLHYRIAELEKQPTQANATAEHNAIARNENGNKLMALHKLLDKHHITYEDGSHPQVVERVAMALDRLTESEADAKRWRWVEGHTERVAHTGWAITLPLKARDSAVSFAECVDLVLSRESQPTPAEIIAAARAVKEHVTPHAENLIEAVCDLAERLAKGGEV